MAEETPKYALENLVVDYNSQASELQDGNTLTGAHMQRIDSALDSAAKAEKVANALNELDSIVTGTRTGLENQMASLRGEVTTQIQNSNTQVQNELNTFRAQVTNKADKTTTDTNAKDKYWKFDENGNLVFVELEMDDKLDTNQGTGNAGKYLKVNELGYVETSNMDQVVNNISDIGDDPNVNYYLKDVSSGTTAYTLYKVIDGNPYKVSGNDSRVDELGQQIIEIGGTVNVIAPMVNSYKLDYDGKELTLTATNAQNNTSEVVSKINIISAETTVNTILTIAPITKNPLITTLDSIPEVQFTFTNTYSESSGGAEIEGEVTAIWKVNNVAVRSETLKSKDASGQLITHSFSPAPYITKGMKYSVLVSLTNEFGTQTQYAWTVNAVALSVNLTLNSTTAYSDDIKFKYIPYGTVSKTVYLHRRKGGSGSFTSIKTYSGVTEHGVEMPADSYVTISKGVLTHGVYTIRAYCATNIDGVNVESKRKYVDIIYAEPGQTTPIIAWADQDEEYKQYTQISQKYSIYNPTSTTSQVKLYLKTPEDAAYKLVSTREANNLTEYDWEYLPISYGDYYFKIEVGEALAVREKKITVAKESYQIDIITDDLAIDFNPQGRSNSDANRLWTSTDGQYKLEVDSNFDWYNGGWITDKDGATAFVVKAGSRAYINFPIFRRSLGDGLFNIYPSFKFVFKTTHCKNFHAQAITCGEDGDATRLRIKAQNAYLYLAGKETRVDYAEEEKLELEYVVNEKEALVSTFLNADPSKLEEFSGELNNSTERYIEIGSDDCDVYLYRFKAYSRAIGYGEVLQNYITDTPIGEEMKARYDRSDIWDFTKLTDQNFAAKPNTEKLKTLFEDINPTTNPITWIDYAKLARKNPGLRVIIITCPRFTTSKDDKVDGCTVQQIMGDGQDPKHNWIATNVQLKGQGTSSNKYGMSARNLDIKCKNGFKSYVNNSEGAAFNKYSMTDRSIGVNYFNLKVNVASSENANNARIAERYNTYDPYRSDRQKALSFLDEATRGKIRDTMEFHPCAIFIKETQKNHNGKYVAQKQVGDEEWEWYELDDSDEANRVKMVEGPLDVLHFYAAGDFGNSKKNHEVFGMNEAEYDNYLDAEEFFKEKTIVEESGEQKEVITYKPKDMLQQALDAQIEGKDDYLLLGSDITGGEPQKFYYPKECIVEIADNATPCQFFKNNTSWVEHDVFDAMPDKDPNGNKVWGEDIEFRYPEALDDLQSGLEEKLGGDPAKATASWYLAKIADDKLKNSARRLWNWVASTDSTVVPSEAQISTMAAIAKADHRIFNRDPITADYLDSAGNKITDPLGANKNERVAITKTYGETTYTYDSKEYRLAKFRAEFDNYLVRKSAFFYYLFTSRYQMIDNRAKNTFLHTTDGLHWDFAFDYDNDTALGIDNFGKLTLDYGTEDTDTFIKTTTDENGNPITSETGRFNGYQSVLWCNIRDCFPDELRDRYSSLEGSNNEGCWSAEGLCTDFENYQNHKPEALQAVDMYNKYVRPKTAGHHTLKDDYSIYVPMMNGRKTSQRRRFEKYQERFFGTKYYTNHTYDNSIVLRPTSSGSNGTFTLRIKAYSKFYPNWSTEQYAKPKGAVHRILQEGEVYDMEFNVAGTDFSSTVLNLLGGPCYADLGDLSFLSPSTATLNKGEKLSVVTLGSKTKANTTLSTIALPDNIEKLNIDNCIALQSLSLNGEGGLTPYTQMKELSAEMNLATGTQKGPTQITLPSNGLLEVAKLGNIETLFGKNLAKLHTLTVQGNSLKNLKLENCGDWSWQPTVNGEPDYNDCLQEIIRNSSIGKIASDPGRVRLTNVNLDFTGEWIEETNIEGDGPKLMDRVLKAYGYNEKGGEVNEGSNSLGWNGSHVDGILKYEQIAEGAYNRYESAWKVHIQAGQTIKQFQATFEDESGNILYQTYCTVEDGKATVYDPVGANRLAEPQKESDEQYTYTWKRWKVKDSESLLEYKGNLTISGDTTFVAVFASTPRTYTIRWNLNNGTDPLTQTLDYGTKLEYPSTLNKVLSKESGTRYDLFKGWDKPLNTVKYDMTINALWENGDVSDLNPATYNSEELNAAQIYTLTRIKPRLSDWFECQDRVTVQVGTYPEYAPINSDNPEDPFLCHDLVNKEEFFFSDKPRIIDTETMLLDQDRDWTIVLDGFMGEQSFTSGSGTATFTRPDGTILACQNSDSVGLRITTESSQLRVYWYGQNLNIGNTDYARIVLRHPKGKTLYISYSSPTSSVITEHLLVTGQTLTPVTAPIYLGAIKTSNGYRSPATGYIRACKMWRADIGEDEALKLCIWPRQDWKFTIINKIADDGNLESLYGGSYLDLWSDSAMPDGTAWGAEGDKYPSSTMQQRFNRLRDGFSETWRTLLKKQSIKYIDPSPSSGQNYEIPNTYNTNGSTSPKDWVLTEDSFDYLNPGKYIQSFETDIYAPALSEIVSVWTIASKDQVAGKDNYLINKYNLTAGTSATPGTLEEFKNRPYQLEGGALQTQILSVGRTWSRSYPSKDIGWFYKQFPANTSWDKIQSDTTNINKKWIYAQSVNPLKSGNNTIFDGCVWINTTSPSTVKNFYTNTFVFWNGKWHNSTHSYIWLRTKTAKDVISIPNWYAHYGYNSAYSLYTSQGWTGITSAYGSVPCISI